MQCLSCKGEWIPPKYILKELDNCPFCGVPVISIKKASSYISMVEFLQYLVNVYGVEIYNKSVMLSGLIADLYCGEDRRKRIYRRVILEDCLSKHIYELSLIPFFKRGKLYDEILNNFIKMNFYEKEFSRRIAESFVQGLKLEIENYEEICRKSYFVKSTCANYFDIHCNMANMFYSCAESVEYWYLKIAVNYLKKAYRGDSDAQCNVGVCYYNISEGAKLNYKEAVKWYCKIMGQNEKFVQRKIDLCCENVQRVEGYYLLAKKWCYLSSLGGNMRAKSLYMKMR